MESIELINYLKAPASVVYQALITQDGLSQVWTNKLKVKPEVGFVNEFDFDEGYITKMKVLQLSDKQKVLWECIDSDPEWIGTKISFELSETGEGSKIVLKHYDWEKVTDFYRWCNYNWAMFLQNLKNYCEDLWLKHLFLDLEQIGL